MKVIVCGGRDYKNAIHLFDWLDRFHARYIITEVVEGGAQGADKLAWSWATKNDVPVTEIRANWGKHGKRAGPMRNQEMLDTKPDAVIAFPGNAGTLHMTTIARKAGIKVYDGSSKW